MDGSSKGIGGGAAADKPTTDHQDQNASPNVPAGAAVTGDAAAAVAAEGRRPFTSLSQEEADLALARVLQEQERAYMMLTAQHGGGEYASSDAGSYDDYDEDEGSDYEDEEGGEDALDEDEEVADAEVAAADLDPARYEDDEAFARALQVAEERDVAGRLMALTGIGDWRPMEQDDDEEVQEEEEDGEDPQDAWEGVDPDEYSYEELIALGEVVGTESKGLSADTIGSLPSVTYHAQDKQEGNMEQCVICRVEFDEGESLVALPCKHPYHSECINQWLQLNKVCPMCSAEVSTSVDKKA